MDRRHIVALDRLPAALKVKLECHAHLVVERNRKALPQQVEHRLVLLREARSAEALLMLLLEELATQYAEADRELELERFAVGA